MYERMLNKQAEPTFDDLLEYSGERKGLWLELDSHLLGDYPAQKLIRFPYGNSYGWGVKYAVKSKHICDIFAEDNAFTVFFRISDKAFESISGELCPYSKELWAKRYPCGEGGWINYRVLSKEHCADVKKIIAAKLRKPTGASKP